MDPDREDIQATLAGDGEAYRQLVERHQQWVAGRMWRFTRDRRELEELVADVFVEVYRSLRRFRGEGPFRAWLGRIATRRGYRLWRRQKKTSCEVPLADWDAPARPGRQLEQAEAAEVVHELLAQLPWRDRLILTLVYLEELSMAEAADRAGWSETMAKVQAHRARKKLRKLIEQHPIGRSVRLEDEP